MRTILRCSSILASRESCALMAAFAKSVVAPASGLLGAGEGAGCFSAVAVVFLLTESRSIDGKRLSVGRADRKSSVDWRQVCQQEQAVWIPRCLPNQCHSERSEESNRVCAPLIGFEYPAGFFAALRMTD